MMVRMLSPIDPRCTGMCGALAISAPSASKIAQEKSSRSLMFTLVAVDCSATPISSAIAMNRLLKISSRTGSTSVPIAFSRLSGTARVSTSVPSRRPFRAPAGFDHRSGGWIEDQVGTDMFLPGTGRGTDRSRRRRLVEGAHGRALQIRRAPATALASSGPSPFRGGFTNGLRHQRVDDHLRSFVHVAEAALVQLGKIGAHLL